MGWKASMSIGKKKVLIVDDEPDTITFLSQWLEDNGYETCSATDGDQGMMAVIEEGPDIILMDLRMPNQTGMQLYRALRLRDEFGHIPVIFVTGMTEFQIFGKDSTPLPKPEAFIEKPINLDALHSAIKRLIG
jgi:CheY-like chemotaxis protein